MALLGRDWVRTTVQRIFCTAPFASDPKHVPCELWAPEDFLEWRYNLLDTSATRVVYYRLEKLGIQPVVGNANGTHVEQVVSSFQKILRGSQLLWLWLKSESWLNLTKSRNLLTLRRVTFLTILGLD